MDEPLKTICAWCEREGIETVLQDGALYALSDGRRVPSHSICKRHIEERLTGWPANRGRVISCPFCGHVAPRRRFGIFARPAGSYAEILRCPSPDCRLFFAPLDIERILA